MKKIVALALACCMVLTGCSGASVPQLKDLFKTDSTQVMQLPSEPETQIAPQIMPDEAEKDFGLAYQAEFGLHPYNCTGLNNRVILSFLYEPLFLVDSAFEAVPFLAESFDVSDDGKTTTVYLKSGVTFHDGTQMSAQDVVYSLESSRKTDYYGTRLHAVTAIEAVNETSLVLKTSTSYECLPLLLDIPIIKAGTVGEAVPMGTGPYTYGETVLTRFDGWWQDSFLTDEPTIALETVSSTMEIRDKFEYEQVNLVRTDPSSAAYASFHNDYELWTGNTAIMQYIGYNLNDKVFSNYGLRSAITYAIDRETLVAERTGGFATPAVLPCSPQTDFYDGKLAASFDYDLDDYQKQLESASVEDMDGDGILDLYVPSLGYAIPVSGTMLVCSTSYQRVQAAQDIVDSLNDLGFDLEVKAVDYDDYKEALIYGNFDLYYGEVRLSSNFDLTQFFSVSGALNYGDLADSVMMNLCEQALVNNGNSYSLYKRLCGRGYITPILFKTYAVYTTRGLVENPAEYLDWFIPKIKETERE
ncbi:MAG: ABC transporter substrate-binding protein [Oscillospiraceae bacterium]|nr:ABC transporter substrate-binding protein [Oscillospiraceae bacterium]